MQNYKNQEKITLKRENNENIEMVVDEYHFFDCYDKTKNGELIIQTLNVFGNQLFCVAGEEKHSIQRLIEMALEWCFDDEIVAMYQNYQKALAIVNLVEEGADVSSDIDDTAKYMSAKNVVREYREDYYSCCFIRNYESELRGFLEKCYGAKAQSQPQ